MALIEMDFASAMGGGCKFGNVDNTTSASQTVTINTGLSSITRFVLVATPTVSGYGDYRQVVVWNANNTYYNAAVIYTNGCYGAVGNIGSYPNASSGMGAYAWKIQSINGGTITLQTSSSNANYGACKDIHWYAE